MFCQHFSTMTVFLFLVMQEMWMVMRARGSLTLVWQHVVCHVRFVLKHKAAPSNRNRLNETALSLFSDGTVVQQPAKKEIHLSMLLLVPYFRKWFSVFGLNVFGILMHAKTHSFGNLPIVMSKRVWVPQWYPSRVSNNTPSLVWLSDKASVLAES